MTTKISDHRDDYIFLYQEIRKEMLSYFNKMQALQYWVVALAGAVAAFGIDALTKVYDSEAIIHQPYDFIALLLIGGIIPTSAFWSVMQYLSRSTIRMGLYLLFLEERLELQIGWETFVWAREAKRIRSAGYPLVTDSVFWIQVCYVLVAWILVLSRISSVTVTSASIVTILLTVGTMLRLNITKYRAHAYSRFKELLEASKDWREIIRNRYV